MSGQSGENRLTLFYLESQLDAKFWSWAADDAAAVALLDVDPDADPGALHEAARALAEYLLGRFAAEGFELEECHAILHNRDLQKGWDEATCEVVWWRKPIHLHLIGKFAGGRKGGATRARIAELLGVVEPQVEKPNKGGKPVGGRSASHDNKLSYLVHIKHAKDWPYGHELGAAVDVADADVHDPWKYPYTPAQVATLRGEDYLAIYRARRDDWLKGRAFVTKKRVAEDAEVVFDKIVRGEITEAQLSLDDDLYEVYARHRRRFDDALAVRAKRESLQGAAAIGDVFRTASVFIHGPSRSGKDLLGQALTEQLLALAAVSGGRWRSVKPAGRNALESVGSVEVVHHEDMRWHMLPTYDEMLRYFDPNQAIEAATRYQNRAAPVPRVIIGTSTETPQSFAYAAKWHTDPEAIVNATGDERRRYMGYASNLNEFLLRLGFVVAVSKPASAKTKAEVMAQAVYAIHRFVEADEYTELEVLDGDGRRLGLERAKYDLELVAAIKGTARAARFLSMEIMSDYSPDIARRLPVDVLDEHLSERVILAAEREHRQRLALADAPPEPVPSAPAFNPQPVVFDG